MKISIHLYSNTDTLKVEYFNTTISGFDETEYERRFNVITTTNLKTDVEQQIKKNSNFSLSPKRLLVLYSICSGRCTLFQIKLVTLTSTIMIRSQSHSDSREKQVSPHSIQSEIDKLKIENSLSIGPSLNKHTKIKKSGHPGQTIHTTERPNAILEVLTLWISEVLEGQRTPGRTSTFGTGAIGIKSKYIYITVMLRKFWNF
jgi:hypothetical protein